MEITTKDVVKLRIGLARVKLGRLIKTEEDIKAVGRAVRTIHAAENAWEQNFFDDVSAMLELFEHQMQETGKKEEARFQKFLQLFELAFSELANDDTLSQGKVELMDAILETSKKLTEKNHEPSIVLQVGYEALLDLY